MTPPASSAVVLMIGYDPSTRNGRRRVVGEIVEQADVASSRATTMQLACSISRPGTFSMRWSSLGPQGRGSGAAALVFAHLAGGRRTAGRSPVADPLPFLLLWTTRAI
jgi:hypothetical protein